MLANIIRNRKKTAIGGGGIVGGDPYFSSVSLLLHMDGTNASTTFTDSGPSALTVTAANATISTTQSKYGGASGSFTGTSSNAVAPSSTLFNFGAGDFTIECWIYWLGGGGSPGTIFSTAFPTDSQGVFIGLLSSGAFNYLAGNGTWAFNSTTTSNALSANQWYHIAYVRSGSTFTVYINGVASGSTTSSPTLTNSNNQAVIGGRNVFGQYFRGFIDDLRISRFARYVSTFTPPTAALPTTASSTPADPYYGYTSLLLHMDDTNASTNFVDSGPNALTVTRTGTPAISTAQSKYGGASAYFDGTAGYLSPPASSGFSFGTGNVTIEAWVYPTATTGNFGIYATSAGGGTVAKFVVFLDSLSPNCHFYGLTNGNNIYTKATSTVAVNQWSHIAFVRSGTTWTWYINGVSSGSGTNSTAITFSTEPTYIGYGGQAFFNYFNGYIDDLRVTKYARYTSAFAPPTQAHLEYANGNDRHFSNVSLLLHMDGANGSTTFTDNSANSYSITKYGTAAISTIQSQFGGASAYFDGSGARLGLSSTAIDFGAGDFTAECWIYLNANPSSSYGQIIGKHVAGISASWIFNLDASRVLSFVWNNAVNVLSTGTALNLSQWYHIAACRNGSTIRVYINGIQSASTTISYTFSSATEFTVGSSANDNANARLNAYIDDIRLTKVARYTSNFTPSTSAFPNA